MIPRYCVLLSLVGAIPALGAPFAGAIYEGFDYPTADMGNTLAGGTGWNASGSSGANTTTWGVTQAPNGTATGTQFNPGGTAANQSITAAGLSHPLAGYPAGVGQGMRISGVGGAGQIGRNFGQTVDAGTIYYSFLVKKTVNEVRTVNFALFGSTGDAAAPQERVTIGQIANNLNIKLPDGTADPDAATKANKGEFVALISSPQTGGTNTVAGVYPATSPIPFAVDTTFLIVTKIEFDVGGAGGVDDRLTVYINPTSISDEASQTPYLQVNGINFGQMIGFRCFAGATQTANGTTFNPSAAEFDEIRFGSSYASVMGTAPATTPWQDWQALHFSPGEIGDPSISGPLADPDFDGSANLLEYAFGSNPRSGAAGPGPVVSTTSSTVSVQYPAPRTDVTYSVETSTNLTSWTHNGVTDVPSTGNLRIATVARTDPHTFLRVRVTKNN